MAPSTSGTSRGEKSGEKGLTETVLPVVLRKMDGEPKTTMLACELSSVRPTVQSVSVVGMSTWDEARIHQARPI